MVRVIDAARRHGRAVGLAGALAVSLGPSSSARAASSSSPPTDEPIATPRFELRWQAPPGCPDAAYARPRVERFLGRAVAARGDPDTDASIAIAARDGLFVAVITIDDSPRELSAERCETVAEAAAYVVAAWIDPSVEPPPLEPSPPAPTSATPTPAPEVAAPDATPATTARPRDDRARPRAAVFVGVGVGVGALPRVGPGVGGGVAATWRWLRVELAVAHLFARPARLPSRPDVGGDIRLTAAAARFCPLVVRRPIELPLCAGFELGSMHGQGVGIDEVAERRALWAAFTAGAKLIWMPSRFVGPWIDATLAVPVSRPVFDAVNVGRIHQPAAATFTGMLGVEARFP